MLVIQDYFTKWAEAIPIPDQTADRITRELINIFTRFGLPRILHSDQGANFESTLLQQTLAAFGVHKSRTTSYHPQGDGMVERLNRTLLQMLRSYTTSTSDWEKHLPLVLFAYRSAVHPTTGLSPFELMFGRSSTVSDLPARCAFEPMSYQADLRKRLAEFHDLVETHHAQAAQGQKEQYDRSAHSRAFVVGDFVWLSCPTAGKLDSRWEGGWEISKVIGNNTFEIRNNKGSKVVHVNRLRHRVQPDCTFVDTTAKASSVPNWQPPSTHHEIVLEEQATCRYPTRERRPPDRLQLT